MARPERVKQTCEQTFGLSDICTRPTRYQLISTRSHLARTHPTVTGVNGLPGPTYNSSPTSIRRLQRKLTRQGVCLPSTNIFGFYGIGPRRNDPTLEHRASTRNSLTGEKYLEVRKKARIDSRKKGNKFRRRKWIHHPLRSVNYHPSCLLSIDGIYSSVIYLTEN